ncbi:hypothetical protein QF026_002365 [Streptomyces aurantiacus]|uniref:hypothetical protein n=1 Tax=Streptomyces aurantiacus TaxID=47760 RepID=UPI00279092BD|nr:hypothetical protein [Streptomyces aurantiacus]MDQ0773899.1 hypothetical protein [Streptomyces aurantiacus]
MVLLLCSTVSGRTLRAVLLSCAVVLSISVGATAAVEFFNVEHTRIAPCPLPARGIADA